MNLQLQLIFSYSVSITNDHGATGIQTYLFWNCIEIQCNLTDSVMKFSKDLAVEMGVNGSHPSLQSNVMSESADQENEIEAENKS